MKDLTEQIYDELNAQVVRMMDDSTKKTLRIVELETEKLAQNKRIAELEAQIAALGGEPEWIDGRNDDPAEAAFWRFDARKNGYSRWKGAPQSERDAFKAEYRAATSTALQAPVREVPEIWISVEDRLPKVEELVIVYAPAGKYSEERMDFDFIDPNDDDHASWFHHNEHYEHFCVVAKPEGSIGPSEKAPYTHWLPLPAAPVQQEGE